MKYFDELSTDDKIKYCNLPKNRNKDECKELRLYIQLLGKGSSVPESYKDFPITPGPETIPSDPPPPRPDIIVPDCNNQVLAIKR